MSLKSCLGDVDENIISIDERKSMLQKAEDYKKYGNLSDREAEQKVLLDYHEQLHKDINKLRKSVGLKLVDYEAQKNKSEDVQKINSEYEAKINDKKQELNLTGKRDEVHTAAKDAGMTNDELKNLSGKVIEKRHLDDMTSDELDKMLDYIKSQKSEQDAIQKQRTKEVLQRKQEEAGKAGSERSGVEQQQQRKETAKQGEEEKVTGIRNSVVNSERLDRGLKPVLKEAKRKFGKVWDEASKLVRSGAVDTRTFVESLHKNPKPVSDTDNALILMDRIDLTNQRIDALNSLEKLKDTNNEYLEGIAWRNLQEIEERLQQNDEVSDRVGTITARALSSRRMLAKLDYTLARMKQEISKFYPTKEVPKEIQERLEKIEKEHAEALTKLQEYEEKFKQQKAKEALETEKRNNAKIKTPKTKSAYDKTVTDKLREAAQKIRESGFGKIQGGEDIQKMGVSFDINDAIAKAIEAIANGIDKGVELAELINREVKEIFKKDSSLSEKELRGNISKILSENGLRETDVNKLSNTEKLISSIKEIAANENAETISKDMVTPVRRLISEYIRNGVTNLDDLLNTVHGDLKDSFTDLTKEDIRDAFSGYGDIRLETRNELLKNINDLKAQANLLAQLSAVAKGEKPLRNVKSTDTKPSKEVTELRKRLEADMKARGITWDNPPRSPEEQAQRALDSLKGRLKSQIDQLTHLLATGAEKAERKGIDLDEEAKALKSERDNLQSIYNDIQGKSDSKISDAEYIERAEKALAKKIEQHQADIEEIKNGTYKPKEKTERPTTHKLEQLKREKDAIKSILDKLKLDNSPKSTPEEIALEQYKDSVQASILENVRRIEDGDFETKKRTSFIKDADAIKLDIELKRAGNKFSSLKKEAAKANRSRLQAIFDKISAWKRFSVLTGIPTIGKLGAAVVYRTIGTPLEELTGAIISNIPGVSTVSKLAPREGGSFFNKNALARESMVLTEWAKAKTYKDALEVLKKGKSELDVRFGKYVEQPIEALEVMGRFHGAMKNFAKRMEFVRAYEKRIQYAADKGFNTSDETVQLTAMSQAYIDANRSIFLQDNALTKAYSAMIKKLEKSDSETWEKTAAFIAKFTMPIVKVPTNFVLESADYSFGAFTGSARLIYHAIKGDLSKLSEKNADSLMRSLKKGSLGLGVMALGYFMPSIAGGYYQQYDKRDKDEVQFDELLFGNVRIPSWATHFPLIEAMQMGATLRRLRDKDIDKGKENAIGEIFGAAGGLLGEVPLFSTPSELIQSFKTQNFNYFWGQQERSLIPLGLQNIAQWTDTDEGDVVKRTPHGIKENVEMALPGLRQNVPEKNR